MNHQPSGKPGHLGMTRLIKAYQNSLKGLAAGYKHEEAIRMETWILVFGTLFLLIIDMAVTERLAMWFCLMLLLTVEVLNSAIEATVDRIGFEYHELSGRAKDLGSAAVFLAMIFTGVVWAVLLGRHLLG
ncbi:MAG TPA: diacylglycerol kinase [Pseudomonadales bacterium]|nr:diacylglycerol kinase [Pseudomonadales bacterium]